MVEHRKHTRLDLEISVEVRTVENGTLAGRTKNISFGGMLIETNEQEKLSPGEKIDLLLIIQEGLEVEFESIVVHTSPMGVGIKFETVEISQYHHFKNLMVLNSPDPDRLLDELSRDPGLLIRGGNE